MTHSRERLEHLCRYLLRPPLVLERLTESTHGQLFELAHPRADGTTHLLLDPLELIEKMTLLIRIIPLDFIRFAFMMLCPRAAWRSVALDVFPCPRCGGRRRVVGAHTGGESLRVLLQRLGLDRASPSAGPTRSPPRAGE